MIAPHRIHGTDYALCVKHGKRVKVGEDCPVCPRKPSAPPDHPGLAKVKPPAPGLANEVALAERMTDAGLVGWEPQFYWALSERTDNGRPRQWHSDFAFPKSMLLVEVEGQVHAIKAQRAVDCLRASTAAALGYRMVRVTRDMIVDGSAVALIRRALNQSARAEGGS